ncbi:uncharacterized protein ELE39_001882 [Cryptosporidium sp. chipmunk genotype I]|uniref:uncharacterized protein n=1 Tax=Cryptosporidium sp. chipmunk genotype I TaxID=1280935 RepID=UPI00351A4DD5|nr:hypothetical protein ELE39_001882 [Cryptosporidium sp. chipmunk genotype I]
MESISRDILELEGILELYNWVENYHNSKVPTKRSIFLKIKSKLNLKIVSKSSLSTPKAIGLLKNANSKACFKQSENLSEKRYFPHMTQNYMGGMIGSRIYGSSIERRSRPSTLCSIYPISAFSRIHETLLDASYKNSRICDYSNSSDGGESSEECRSYINEEASKADYDSSSMHQETNGKSLEKGSEKSVVERTIVMSETEVDGENYNTKYRYEIDTKSLNHLIIYLKNIIRSQVGSHCINDGDYLKKGNNFCFLTLWKKIEELTQQKAGDLNEEMIVWQQLRDVLLLTGMSLKYPTWSGEQLTNIITRILPKKMLNLIIENSRNKFQTNSDKNKICNLGLSELYYTFIESSKTVFDLFTVSKLIQESLSKYINIIKTLKCNKASSSIISKETVDIGLKNNPLSSEEEDFLEVISTYSTCGEYGFDEDGYASVIETEYNEFSASNKVIDSSGRESKLIDSLGLFVNLSDVKRPLIDKYTSSKVSDGIDFSNGTNMENSNTTIITSSTNTATTANTNSERSNNAKLIPSVADINNEDNEASFEFNINNSVQEIGENVINLGMSRRILQDLVSGTLIRNSSSSSLVHIEKETLLGVCRAIDDCIYHSNSILEHCNKNKVVKGKGSSRRTLMWFFISIIIMLFIIFVGEYNDSVVKFIERAATTSCDQNFTSGKISIRSLNSKDKSEFHDRDNSHPESHTNLIKASDCILSKDINQSGVNSDICNVIGDITVIQKCFTNINISHRN